MASGTASKTGTACTPESWELSARSQVALKARSTAAGTPAWTQPGEAADGPRKVALPANAYMTRLEGPFEWKHSLACRLPTA